MQASLPFQFREVTDTSKLDPLKSRWRKTLTAPQDGMWEALTDQAAHWLILLETTSIGYICVNDEGLLLQFFVIDAWMHEGPQILQKFISQEKIEKALIGTNNPVALSTAMHLQQAIDIHTYLFEDLIQTKFKADRGEIKPAKEKDLDRLVDYFHNSTGAPTAWLSGYVLNLIQKGEMFMLAEQEDILGTCEVRKSETNTTIADIGMVVSPDHRRKGLGTYLLGYAKHMAIQWGRKPICSTTVENIGSLKAIHTNGFRSIHQMLLLTF